MSLSSAPRSMDYITDVRGKEDMMEGFVGSSPILIHEPSSSSTRAPGDNAVISLATNEAGGTCSASTDILPDGQGSSAAESQLFSLLLPGKAPSNSSMVTEPTDSIGTTRETSSNVVDVWQHTRRPRRSFAAEFKLKAVAYYKQGNTKAATAKFFGIHRKRIQEWIQQESVLRSSPSYKRRMTQTVVAASESEKGEVQSEDSVEGADGLPVTASNTIDESDFSHTGAFTHIQTLTTLPLAAVQVDGVGTQVPAGSPTAVPTSGRITTGKEVTLQNIVFAEACSSVPVLVVQPTRSTSSPVSPARATFSPHPQVHITPPPTRPAHAASSPLPSVHTTPLHIPPIRAVSVPIPSAHTTPPPIPPSHTTPPPIPPTHTTPSSAPNDSSQLPSSRATHESNVAFLKTLSDGNVAKLLDAMNLSRYKERFLVEQVDGELLSSLRQSEFRELGVESGLHQLKLLKLVQGIYSAERFLSKAS